MAVIVLCLSSPSSPGELFELSLLQRMGKHSRGVVGSSHIRDVLGIVERFFQYFHGTGYMCDLGTGSMKNEGLR